MRFFFHTRQSPHRRNSGQKPPIPQSPYGKDCDSTIFKNTSFWKCIDQNLFPLPHPKPLPGSREPYFPHVLLGDEAFGLHANLMYPYEGKQLSVKKRILNYRLSRGRRSAEYAPSQCLSILL